MAGTDDTSTTEAVAATAAAASTTAKPVKVTRPRVFGPVTLGLFMFGFIANINGLPAMAEYGLASIFFYAFALLFLLIPTGLVAAELAAGWPRTGGIYEWTKLAFGPRVGFAVIWLEWIIFAFAFPSVVALFASQIAYATDPGLEDNRFLIAMVVLAATWGATLLAARGLRLMRDLNTVAVVLGTIVPALVMVGLGIAWLAGGNESATPLNAGALVPDFGSLTALVFASTAFLMFSGIEVAAVHAGDVRDPGRSFPRGTLLAVLLTAVFFPIATIAVALVVPAAELNLVTGLVQAFEALLDRLGIGWLLIPMVVCLLMAGRDGSLPPFLRRVNGRGMPIAILVFQGVIDTALSLVFVLAPSVEDAWWMLLIIQTQLTLIMYIAMYLAAIRLRRMKPDVDRPFKLPGGTAVLGAVCWAGIAACVLVVGIGVLPPEQLGEGDLPIYAAGMVAGVAAVVAAPFAIRALALRSARKRGTPDDSPDAPTDPAGSGDGHAAAG
jgi:amino acid transporter